jgi:hypothetical protein
MNDRTTMSQPIDIALPTYGGSEVITTTLDRLQTSIDNSPLSINRLVVDYRPKDDITATKIKRWCSDNGVGYTIHTGTRSLPESREFLCNQIDTDWFLFLDDDVRLRENTLSKMHNSMAPAVGGVQVRKARHADAENFDWSKWRTVRGTTFATLIRTSCVQDISIPSEITQLEDEYIRQEVERHDKLWVFNHQAVIDHENQDRHDINFREGVLAAKYGLLPYDYVFGNVPYNVLTWGHPWKHTKRALGFCWGQLRA